MYSHPIIGPSSRLKPRKLHGAEDELTAIHDVPSGSLNALQKPTLLQLGLLSLFRGVASLTIQLYDPMAPFAFLTVSMMPHFFLAPLSMCT